MTNSLLMSVGVAAVSPVAWAADVAVFNAATTGIFTYGDFAAAGAVNTAGGSIVIDTGFGDPALPDGLFGGLGAGLVGTFDSAIANLEVTLRVDPLNAAQNFRVLLRDNDGPTSGDDYTFQFDLTGITPGQTVTLSQNLLSPGPIGVGTPGGQFPGDRIQNFGLTQLQVQSRFGLIDRLFIDIDSIKIVDPTNPLITELTTSTFNAIPSSFTFGTFSGGGADASGSTFVINADPTAPGAPTFGGLGVSGLNVDFDASMAALEINAKLLAGNAAGAFRISLSDDDGDDSGPGLGEENFIFLVDTADLNFTDFSTILIPLGPGSQSSIETAFGSINSGDGLQNFDLRGIQIQAADEDAPLNLEVASVRIIEFISQALAGDFNGNGIVEQADLDLVLGDWGQSAKDGDWIANTAGLTDGVDQDELDAVLGNWGSGTAPSFAGFSVPEPATASLLGGLALTGLRRRRA